MNCPRCNTEDTEETARSGEAWTIHLCGRCFYGWRSSEAPAFREAERYDARFRLTGDSLAGFRAFPPVPPRRVKSGR